VTDLISRILNRPSFQSVISVFDSFKLLILKILPFNLETVRAPGRPGLQGASASDRKDSYVRVVAVKAYSTLVSNLADNLLRVDRQGYDAV
jgi:hypothetical protein